MKSIEELALKEWSNLGYPVTADGIVKLCERVLAAYSGQQEPIAWLRDDGRYISPSSHEIHMARDNWAQGFDTPVYADPVVPADTVLVPRELVAQAIYHLECHALEYKHPGQPELISELKAMIAAGEVKS